MARRPIRYLLRAAAYLAGTALLFGTLEWQARRITEQEHLDVPVWYASAITQVAHAPIDVVCVGSSRMAYAIQTSELESRLSAIAGRPVRVLNLGQGYATWVEHALGVVRLIESAPHHLRGAILAIEAPSGRVPLGSWAQWYHPFSPGLLQMVLRPADLPRLWRSPETFDRKVGASLERLWYRSALLRHRRRLRDYTVDTLTASVFGLDHDRDAPGTGGTRPGTLTLANTRLRMVLQGIGLGKTARDNESAPTEWLVEQALASGLVPVLVEIPEHPERMDYGGYSDRRHENRRGRLGFVPLIRQTVSPSREDFFDGIHLNSLRAREYTDGLARELATRIR